MGTSDPGAGPGPDVDLDALLDLATPWCLRVIATFGIVDLLAAGVEPAAELAAASGCDATALQAVLAHLAVRGVVRSLGDGRYGVTPATLALRERARFLALDGIGGRLAGAWATLPVLVRTGRPGYAEAFGRPFWDDLAAHPALAAEFDALMGPEGHGPPDHDVKLAGAPGWDAVRHVVDVGGGTGALLAHLLRLHPHVRGTLVERPGTVDRAAPVLAAGGVADRVTVAAQSFFDPLPAGADVYLLHKVLNDWPDPETVAILRRCAEAAGPPGNGRVVVVGGVAADDTPRPLPDEIVLVGGTTSTLDRFRELAARAGLAVVAAGPQPSGRFAVECRPA